MSTEPEDPKRAHLALVLGELGQLLGLPDLAPDEHGNCCLEFDGKTRVWIEHDPGAAMVRLSHVLGPRPATGTLDRWALENSFSVAMMRETFVVLNGATQNFEVVRRCLLDGMAMQALYTALEEMLDAVALWQEAYRQVSHEQPPAEPERIGQPLLGQFA